MTRRSITRGAIKWAIAPRIIPVNWSCIPSPLSSSSSLQHYLLRYVPFFYFTKDHTKIAPYSERSTGCAVSHLAHPRKQFLLQLQTKRNSSSRHKARNINFPSKTLSDCADLFTHRLNYIIISLLRLIPRKSSALWRRIRRVSQGLTSLLCFALGLTWWWFIYWRVSFQVNSTRHATWITAIELYGKRINMIFAVYFHLSTEYLRVFDSIWKLDHFMSLHLSSRF